MDDATNQTEALRPGYDVVVVGGGAAGLNGALMLARSRRSVLVVDAGAPRNSPADGVHGLLGLDGISPRDLLARGRHEVRGYGGQVVTGEVLGATPGEGGFTVSLESGEQLWARRLLVTTGTVDELPDLPGLSERWGHDVLHCPYCHGWEVRDRAISVLATTAPQALHQALLFRQLSEDVTVLSHTAEALGDDDLERLAARGIRVVAGEVVGLEIDDDRLDGVLLADGTTVAAEALVVGTRTVPRSGLLAALGLEVQELAGWSSALVPSDAAGRSTVPGIWVAGNVTEPFAQVGAAAAGGAFAGAQINADLAQEDTTVAVETYRAFRPDPVGTPPGPA